MHGRRWGGGLHYNVGAATHGDNHELSTEGERMVSYACIFRGFHKAEIKYWKQEWGIVNLSQCKKKIEWFHHIAKVKTPTNSICQCLTHRFFKIPTHTRPYTHLFHYSNNFNPHSPGISTWNKLEMTIMAFATMDPGNRVGLKSHIQLGFNFLPPFIPLCSLPLTIMCSSTCALPSLCSVPSSKNFKTYLPCIHFPFPTLLCRCSNV